MVYLYDMDLPERGGYVLLLRLEESCEILIGRLGRIRFDPGYYNYVGSAMGGLRQRISRHLRKEKKLHWHIDYLLCKASVENVIVCQSEENVECDVAGEIGKVYDVINGFGSSDCKCSGHLFHSPSKFDNKILNKLISTGMKPRLILDDQDNGN